MVMVMARSLNRIRAPVEAARARRIHHQCDPDHVCQGYLREPGATSTFGKSGGHAKRELVMMGSPTGRSPPHTPAWNDEDSAPFKPVERSAYGPPDDQPEAVLPLGRRAYATPYESLTFSLTTRAKRDLTVTLAAQPVFDLDRSVPVSRRIRRTVRHQGGERALTGLGRRTLEPADLQRIDLQTLHQGLEILRLGSNDSGVLPVFWRTVAT
ncbi:MAG: hypothetical protein EON48_18255, partial [Acetobacteraceae bacterium]